MAGIAVGVAQSAENCQMIVGSLYRPPRHSVAALQAEFADLEFQLQRILIDHHSTICYLLRSELDVLKSPIFLPVDILTIS